MSVQQSLRGLMAQISPTIEVMNSDEIPSNFDFHSPMLSLPLAFRTTLQTIPTERQYLKSDGALRVAWSARLPAKIKSRIGVVWSGVQLIIMTTIVQLNWSKCAGYSVWMLIG